MANLQIKGIDDRLYEEIKALAAMENRSVSQQVLFLLRLMISRKNPLGAVKSTGEMLLELSGSWQDPKTPEEIVSEIRSARKNSEKPEQGF